MATQFVIIQKPPYRAPCNHCGECCKAGPCDLAADYLNAPEDKMCPALEVGSDGRFVCGLHRRPLHYINPSLIGHEDEIKELTGLPDLIAQYLGFGQGCQMQDEPRVTACAIPEWA